MVYIDPNITYSQELCGTIMGGVLGGAVVITSFFKFLYIMLFFYAIYKISNLINNWILLRKEIRKSTKEIKKKKNKRTLLRNND